MPEAQPQPPPKAMPKEVRDKLRKLRDLAERRESDIKHGAEPPLPEIEKSAMLLVLDSYKDYKDTPEYAQAWNAVVGAELAAGPH
jgi:transcriptional antiterminator